jgi:hypothetical protein
VAEGAGAPQQPPRPAEGLAFEAEDGVKDDDVAGREGAQPIQVGEA